ncbi:hypothetical protein OG746_38235 [Streptomyces sp. NBC_01016]|uniref:hypothetical protein n=1 Tax=Streptomyces sp. NBC_01016 TaxID=2903720 RepID=UPI002252DC18|nr:hypothetical protein [Streptomyces sp. NBC_01016]MCX4834550.1 hypothetical protein [Streptomyces sp. NBC_01016]
MSHCQSPCTPCTARATSGASGSWSPERAPSAARSPPYCTHEGAAEIVVSHLLDPPLRIAAASGATATVRADDPGNVAWTRPFDVAVVTHTFPLAEARAALDLAHDRPVAPKVLLDLTGA